MMNRKMKSAQLLNRNIDLLKCPICAESFQVVEMKSLICKQGHTFDLAKQGYVNFATRPIHTHYGKSLFEARQKIIVTHKFFDPLVHHLTTSIGTLSEPSDHHRSLLDLGCGEGSLLAAICNNLYKNDSLSVVGCGIDLAKEGIQLASKHYPDQMWFVGDLAQPVFENHQFDFILNILSPSNYQVVNQLLKPGGHIIKVIPGSHYLQELRSFFYGEEKNVYSNTDIKALFMKHYPKTRSKRITYDIKLNQEGVNEILQMTPLAWTATRDQCEQWLEKSSAKITADFEILIGEMNGHDSSKLLIN
ncbi:putative RNA methyltransferase [Sporolactobacillus kofuensis]|uniref:RNA methyltransferase n=1 Tax=Sporolactobacillus kofuensis TaxID=269672 RepID=A0ABW1WIR1_9BACL|nr:methyltransferase domain-containing protein [Sporolactobacillus kofuensis]MCO7176282.1 methyltransferase domain-containing protein [Sporolactobacillus kofuensis]